MHLNDGLSSISCATPLWGLGTYSQDLCAVCNRIEIPRPFQKFLAENRILTGCTSIARMQSGLFALIEAKYIEFFDLF